MVWSPFTTSIAAFALNAAEWLRRGYLMLSYVLGALWLSLFFARMRIAVPVTRSHLCVTWVTSTLQ